MTERSIIFHIVNEVEKNFITDIVIDKTHIIDNKLYIFSKDQRVNSFNGVLVFNPYVYVVLSIMATQNKNIQDAINFLKVLPVNSNLWPSTQCLKYKDYINKSTIVNYDRLDTLGLIINKVKYIDNLNKCNDILNKLTYDVTDKIDTLYCKDFSRFNDKMRLVSYLGDTSLLEFHIDKLADAHKFTLTNMANHYCSDKGSLHGCANNYCLSYEKIFEKYRNNEINLYEIGIARGSSLKMWSTYFPKGQIYSIDINPNCKDLCKDFPNIHLFIGDAATYVLPDNLMFDFIIDDGSHASSDIIRNFEHNFNRVKQGGYYIIEDGLACDCVSYMQTVHSFYLNNKQTNLSFTDWYKTNDKKYLDNWLINKPHQLFKCGSGGLLIVIQK